MGALVEPGQMTDGFKATEIADDHDVEEPIVRTGIRSNPHPGTKVTPIGDRNRPDPGFLHKAVVGADPDRAVAVDHQTHHRCPQEVNRPAQDQGAHGCTPDDFGANPHISSVDEVTPAGRAAQATDIDPSPSVLF